MMLSRGTHTFSDGGSGVGELFLLSCLYFFFFFFCFFLVFFFQAEDGIRDVAVTGVQTCALPICVHLRLKKKRRRTEVRGGHTPTMSTQPTPNRVRDERKGAKRDRKSVV